MPGYTMHLIAAKHFLRALSEEEPLLEEKILYNFMMGQIVPDLASGSPVNRNTQHFRDPNLNESKYSDGIIIVPDLTVASDYFKDEMSKSKTLKEKAYLIGILFHLWLDYDFFVSYLFPRFTFNGGIVTNKNTGRKYSYEQFISKKGNGIYNAYDCMAFLYGNEVAGIIESLPVQPEPTHIDMYDRHFDVNKNWKEEIKHFATSANFKQSAIDLNYAEIHNFLVESSRELFIKNHGKVIKALQ